ncbi:MAG: Ig-like domain-containing protein [Gemmatimonadaceae bacterium]|nr:Ig-like domain-containing protein [Gemmatimonadaceae bacterium]
MLQTRRSLRLLAALAGLSLLSCGREVTGPGDGLSYGRGLVAAMRLEPVFPAFPGADAISDLIPFTQVRVTLRRTDGQVAKDTVIDFPSAADSVALTLDVPLPLTTPDTGVTMGLSMAYLNAQGDTVFRGGPLPVTARGGSRPGAPVVLPISPVYPGGVVPASVTMSPDTGSAVAGTTSTFTSVVRDAQGGTLTGVPVFYAAEDTARATVANIGVGSVQWRQRRGAARVIARVAVGTGFVADTSTVQVALPPALLGAVSGDAQSATVGQALAQPVVLQVTATDAVPVAGVPVTFAVTTGGGTLNVTADTSDASGLVSVNWTLGATLGAQSLTASVPGVATATRVVTATGTAPVASRLVFTAEPAGLVAGAAIAPLTVQAQDGTGALASTFTGAVTIALAPNGFGATVGGTATVNAVGGVATFPANITTAGTGYRLIATSGVLTPDTTAAFDVTAAAASQLVRVSGDGQSGTVLTALAAPFVVRATDAFGNGVAGVSVTWALTAGAGVVAAPGTTTDATGQASTGFTLATTPGASTVAATAAGLTGSPVTFSATAVPGTASQLVFTLNPGAAIAGQAITPAWTLEARDGLGNLVPGFTGAVTVALGGGPGGGTLAGTTTVNAVAGVATFAGLSVDRAGSGWTLTASSAGLADATSAPFTITAADAAAIAVVAGNAQTGGALAALPGQVTFRTTDAFGNLTVGTPVTIAVTTGGGSVGTVGGVTNASGELSTTWTLGGALGAQSITATIVTAPAAQAVATATAVPGAATQLAITSGAIPDGVAGVDQPPVVIEVRDAAGNLVPGFTGTVYGHADVTPQGPWPDSIPEVAVGGVATFAAINLSRVGSYQLRFSSPGLADVSPNAFTIVAGPAASMFPDSIAPGDGQTAPVATPLPLPLRVGVHDTEANPIAGVPVVFTTRQGVDTVRVDTVSTDGTGIAAFTPTLPPTAGPVQFVATSAGLANSGLVFNATALPRAASQVVITSGAIPNTLAGVIVPDVVLEVRDAFGNVVPGYSTPIWGFVLASPDGPYPDSVSAATVNGVAVFDFLNFPTAGTYQLRFRAPGVGTVDPAPFDILVGPATRVFRANVNSGDGQTAPAGTALPLPLRTRVTDAGSNGIGGVPVVYTMRQGVDTLRVDTVTTNATGFAPLTPTLPPTPGLVEFVVTSTGLTGSGFVMTATATVGAAVRLEVTQQPGNAASLAVIPATSVRAVDGAGNLVSGFTGLVEVVVDSGPQVGWSLGGTQAQNAVAGVATFADLTLTTAGQYRWRFRSAGLDSTVSAPFTIAVGAPAAIAAAGGDAQAAVASAVLPDSLAARVEDAAGNGIAGVTVTWTVQSGGGSVSPLTGVTDAAGIARTQWTLGAVTGVQEVSASALALAPRTFTATASASVANVVWTGATSTAWGTAANWSGNAVPAAADSVRIPAGTPFAPALDVPALMSRLLVEPGATLELVDQTLSVNGTLDVAPGGGITASTGGLILLGGSGTVRGAVARLVVLNGTHTTNGPVTIAGPLEIGGGTFANGAFLTDVQGDLFTSGAGVLEMTTSGTLNVSGNATFGGGSTAGLLTNGNLVVRGDLTQVGGAQDALAPSGGHAVTLAGTGPQTISLATPDLTRAAGCVTGSCFNRLLSIRGAGSGSVTFLSDAKMTSELQLTGDSVIAPGHTLLAVGQPEVTADVVIAGAIGWQTALIRTGGIFQVDTLVAWGNAGSLIVGETIATRVEAGTYQLAGPHPASLTIVNDAAVDVVGTVAVGGGDLALVTRDNGRLRMQEADDTLTVTGNVSFGGSSLGGDLSDGVLVLNGNFAMINEAQAAFVASGAHLTRITGPNATIAFSAPNGSQFGQLEIDAVGGATFNGDARVAGDVTLGANTSVVGGANLVSIDGSLIDAVGSRWQVALTRFTGADPVIPPQFLGSVEFLAGVGLDGPLTVTGTVTVSGGELTLGGHRLDTDGFATAGTGYVRMSTNADTLAATGSVVFGGAATTGHLIDGVLYVGGDFTQTGDAASFGASGAHRTVFNGSGDQTISLANANPGAGNSHFAALVDEQALPAARLILGTSVLAEGMLIVPSLPGGAIVGAAGLTLSTYGADVRGATFEGIHWEITAGAPILALDSLTFLDQDPNGTALALVRPSGSVTLVAPTFQTVPAAGGGYLLVNDVDGAASGTFAVNVTSPSPATHGGFATAINGAELTGWPAFAGLTWSGATDADWTNPANWVEGQVPTPGDSVRIPAGAPRVPTVVDPITIRALVNEHDLPLLLPSLNTITITERLALRPDTVGIACTNGGTVAVGATNASARGLIDCSVSTAATGTVTLSGPLRVGGTLGIHGGATLWPVGFPVRVLADLVVDGTAALQMTSIGDSVEVSGTANFQGRSTSGLLSFGVLTLRGGLQAGTTPDAFAATGSHLTRFEGGAVDTATVASPGPVVQFAQLRVNRPVRLQDTVLVQQDAFVDYGGSIVGTGRLVVADTLYGVSGTRVSPRVVELFGTLADTALFRPDTTIFSGTGQAMPFRVGALGTPQYQTVRILGTVTPLFTGAPDSIAGTLEIAGTFSAGGAGQPGDLRIAGDLTVTAGGLLASAALPHTLTVYGDATFDGRDSEGALTSGTLAVWGDFRQLASQSPRSFRAAPGFAVRLEGSGAVSFGTSGESHFGRLEVVQTGITRTFESDANVLGVLNLAADGGATFASSLLGAGGTRLVRAEGLAQSGTFTFRNVGLVLQGDSTIATNSTLTFADFDPAVVQLEIARAGGTVTLFDPVFSTAPTGAGRYLRAQDTAPGNGDDLVVDINGAPTPLFHGGFAEAVAPAQLLNWADVSSFRWTGGATTSDWTNTANWANAQVPTAADSVFVPDGLLYNPVIPDNTTLRAFVSARTASPLVAAGSFTVTERLVLPTTGGLLCSGALQFQGSATPVTVRGRAECFTRALAGTTTVLDTLLLPTTDLQVEGTAVVTAPNGLLEVGGQFSTLAGGVLAMTTATSHVRLLQGATFSGGSTAGLLTSGLLEVGGNFTQGTTATAFQASAAHTTRFMGTVDQSMIFSDPGIDAGSSRFANLEVGQPSGATAVRLNSDVFAAGQVRDGPEPFRRLLSDGGALLVAHGASLSGALLSHVRLELRDGQPIGLLSSLEFAAQDPTLEQLRILRSDGVVGASALVFDVVPTTGAYIRAEDPDGTANGSFVLSLSGTTPTSHGGRVVEANGATITGWGANDPATANVWTGGAADGNWFSAANWSLGRTPTTTDSVVVEGNPTVTVNGVTTVAWLVAGITGTPTLQLVGGTLQIDSVGLFGTGATFTQTGGTLTGDGVVSILGAFNWNGGTQRGSGGTGIQGTGTAAIAESGPVTLDARTLVISGQTQLGAAGLTAIGNPAISIGTTGELILGSSASFFDGNGQVQLSNAGILRKAASAGAVRIDWPIVNVGSGRIIVEDDTLDLRNALTQLGTVEVQPGAWLLHGGETAGTGSFTVGDGGILEFRTGGISLNAGRHLLAPGSGVSGAGTLRIISADSTVIEGTLDVDSLVVQNGYTAFDGLDSMRVNVGTFLGGGSIGGTGILVARDALSTAGLLAGSGTIVIPTGATLAMNSGTVQGFAFDVAGRMDWADQNWDFQQFGAGGPWASLLLRAGGELRIAHGAVNRDIFGGTGSAITVQAGGAITKVAGTAVSNFRQAMQISGTVTASTGSINFQGSCSVTGGTASGTVTGNCLFP